MSARKVLLVDDDRRLLRDLKEGLARYANAFSVVLAGDGAEALECLKRLDIALVVTDLKMPAVDGFELLAAVMDRYPDIPVIIITGFSSPELEALARRSGAMDVIAKPFRAEALARQVLALLRRQTEGGLLHNISTGVFLQLIEVEQKTCTLRLYDKATGRTGVLFFRDGELLDARCGALAAEAAALEVFAWDHVSLAIQNECVVGEKRIRKELPSLLLEAARRSDEVQAEAAGGRPRHAPPPPAVRPPRASDPEELRRMLDAALGSSNGIEAVRADSTWDDRLEGIARCGERLGLGRLCAGYIDRSEQQGCVFLPGRQTTAIWVTPRCPRDRLFRVLEESGGEGACTPS
jgi:DNA-binding response OmpR family regulator